MASTKRLHCLKCWFKQPLPYQILPYSHQKEVDLTHDKQLNRHWLLVILHCHDGILKYLQYQLSINHVVAVLQHGPLSLYTLNLKAHQFARNGIFLPPTLRLDDFQGSLEFWWSWVLARVWSGPKMIGILDNGLISVVGLTSWPPSFKKIDFMHVMGGRPPYFPSDGPKLECKLSAP